MSTSRCNYSWSMDARVALALNEGALRSTTCNALLWAFTVFWRVRTCKQSHRRNDSTDLERGPWGVINITWIWEDRVIFLHLKFLSQIPSCNGANAFLPCEVSELSLISPLLRKYWQIHGISGNFLTKKKKELRFWNTFEKYKYCIAVK